MLIKDAMAQMKSMNCEDAEYAVCLARRQLEMRQKKLLENDPITLGL